MDHNSLTKKYPSSSDEVAKMLKLSQHGGQTDKQPSIIAPADLPVANLPIVQSKDQPQSAIPSSEKQAPAKAGTKFSEHLEELPLDEKKSAEPAYVKILKTAAPYLAIFILGIFLYYFFFTGVDFNAIFKLQPKASTPQVTAINQLEQQDLASYDTWIKSFYYDVSNPTILAPETDNSGNGLSNFQKYLLNLNPKSYDTLGLGMADSQSLAQGIDPLTGGPLTDAQKSIISKYIDMEVVMNRLTLYNLENPGQVAGTSISANGQTLPPAFATGTNTAIRGDSAGNGNGNGNIAPVTSPQLQDSSISINYSIPGRLQIPDLKINVPINWPQSSADFDNELQTGVIHYPGTSLPGQIGTTYIAGHSSNYIWAKGSYNHIFSTLGNLAINSSFSITVTQTNGQTITFDYAVIKTEQFSPTDPAQIQNTGQSLVALSTCWPVDTTSKRLVVYGLLTQIEQ
jgi:LPXTG-site transpeptidase (sortase) family protein